MCRGRIRKRRRDKAGGIRLLIRIHVKLEHQHKIQYTINMECPIAVQQCTYNGLVVPHMKPTARIRTHTGSSFRLSRTM